MLYFAYGSNLHQKQMKRRCKNSKYIGCYTLKNFKLSFRNYYLGGGVADIEKKENLSETNLRLSTSRIASKTAWSLIPFLITSLSNIISYYFTFYALKI